MNYSNYDKLLDAVFIIDEQKKIHYANECASLLVGVSSIRLQKGHSVYKHIQFADESLFCMEEGTFDPEADESYREVEFVTKKGGEGICQILIEKDCNGPYWIVFIRDMTLENSLHSKYKAELAGKEDVIRQLELAKIELQKYSEGLEEMVEERTAQLNHANKFLQAMMNSLGQGLLVFDGAGICQDNYTKACESLFEASPNGKKIWDIIRTSDEKVVRTWAEGIFKELIPFDSYAQLGPKSFTNGQEQYIELEYFAMRDDDDAIEGIVTVATDKTAEMEAKRQVEKERRYADMIIKMITCKEQFLNFINASRAMIAEVYEELANSITDIDIRKIFIAFHSIKGGAGQFGFSKVEEVAHEYENHLSQVRDMDIDQISGEIFSIKSNTTHLEKILEDEIRSCRQFLGDQVIDGKKRIELSVDELRAFGAQLDQTMRDQFEAKFLRGEIENYFIGHAKMAQEIALKQEKEIGNLDFINGKLKVDPEFYQELFSAMVHVFRNSADHGIESKSDRIELGKRAEGRILIEFQHDCDLKGKEWLSIIVSDDGRGIDPEKIKEKCLAKGIAVEGEDDHTLIQRIFLSGLSTKEEVTSLSGRGVGMDAIKTAAEKMGGKVTVFSRLGCGARVEVVVPWDQYVKRTRGAFKNAS